MQVEVKMLEETIPCRIAKGFDGAGKKGQYIGKIKLDGLQWWALVIFEGDDDPDLFKVSGLEISRPVWEKLS